ncbi:FG-GAP repeat protein [Peristeroidobacter agariperforans]|uniref:FG-GAP repeat protein n=1 Tax=Peristeroidobacter agariperforans TaxID=268404 RepID=UPI0018E4FC58|nr:FG-GAP repeat protein [Peristeroidobacter agariperforans]
MRTRIIGVCLASVALTMVMGTASASPLSRPTPRASLAAAPWNSTPDIITSEYEYHEPTNQSKNQQYGGQVALSGDGSTLAVADAWYFGGSEWPWYGSGAVYVYRRVSTGWQLEAKLEPPAARGYDFFGSDVALSNSGNVLVVGAQYEGYDAPSQDAGPGSAFVYKRRSGVWTQESLLRASRAQDSSSFGKTVEVSSAGDVIAVGAPYEDVDSEGAAQRAAGAVYVFKKQAGAWAEQQAVTAPAPQSDDWFGWGLRLSEDGRTLAVLAAEQNADTEDWENGGWPNRANTVYLFQRGNEGAWNVSAQFEGSASEPHFGGTAYEPEGQAEGFDLSADGRTLAIGSPFAAASDGAAGVIRMYRRATNQWLPTNTVLTPALPDRRSFGSRVTLSAHGKTLVAFADRDDGAYGQPYVVAFDQRQNTWQQTGLFESPAAVPVATGFANSLTLSWSGCFFALGARTYSTETSTWGAAFNYRRQASAQ